jgi:hypothetical protein
MSACAVVKTAQGRQFIIGKMVYWWEYGMEKHGVLHNWSRHGVRLRLEIRSGASIVYKDSESCSH